MRYDALLSGKRALVTGGAQGIGRAIALLYARHGAKVAIVDVVEDEGRQAEKELQKLHPDCFYMTCDAGIPAELNRFMQEVDRRFGGIDVLDNNVGINHPESVAELSDERFQRILSVNLRSAYALCRRYMPGMAERGNGAVLFTSTIHSVATVRRFGSYAASKGAINALCRALAVEYGPRGIRVNVVAPGGIHSSWFDSYAKGMSDFRRESFSWELGDPCAWAGTSQDIADAHLYFAGDMARGVTGQSFLVDMGSSSQLHGTDTFPYPDRYPLSKRFEYFKGHNFYEYRSDAPPSVYEELGVKTYLNAWDGTPSPGDATWQAMREASGDFVEIADLQAKVGEKIAELTHNEAAYVVSGPSAGILLACAACMAGDDEERLRRLPDASDMKNEIIIPRSYPSEVIRSGGAKVVTVGDSADELIDAFTDRTAAVFLMPDAFGLPLREVVRIAHARDAYVVVEGPLHTQSSGADLSIFSGVDARGPEQSGVVAGRRGLIDAIAKIAPPNQGLARACKIGKEEIIGFYTALCAALSPDGARHQLRYLADAARHIAAQLGETGLFQCEILGDYAVRAAIPCAEALCRALREGEPGILVGRQANFIYLHAKNLTPNELEQVVFTVKQRAMALSGPSI